VKGTYGRVKGTLGGWKEIQQKVKGKGRNPGLNRKYTVLASKNIRLFL